MSTRPTNGPVLNGSMLDSPTIRLPKKAEVVARRIAASIVDRQMAPGTVMPNEPEMLAELRVARSTLREALRLLETQGVLSLQAGRSPIVRRPPADGLLNSLTLLLQFQGGTFGTLLRGRVLFEPAIAAEAARQATSDDLAALRANIDAALNAFSLQERVRRELEFHRLIADASHNTLATLLVSTLSSAISHELANIHVEHDFSRETQFHDSIHDALAARDAARAEQLMREHIQELLTEAEEHHPALVRRRIHWM